MSNSLSLRPRSTPEIIDAVVVLLRRDYSSFVTLSAIIHLPWLAFLLLIIRGSTASESAAVLPTVLGMVGILGWLFWYPVVDAAILLAMSESFMGRKVEVGKVISQVLRKVGPILAVVAMRGILVIAGFLALFIPAIIVYLTYFAAPAVVVLEDKGATESLSRSSFLTKGHKWRIFAVLLIVGFVVMLASLIGSLAALFVDSILVSQVVSTLVAVALHPVQAAATTIVYYDLRVRQDGLDIELLAGELEAPTVVPAS